MTGPPSHLPPGKAIYTSLLGRSLLAFTLIFILLEIWRPCYFLTDDNLSVGLSLFTEMGRHLKSGQSPFYSDYIFGGHYNLLRDPSFFVWHPVCLFASLFADTPLRFWIMEIVAFFYLVIATAGFTSLAFYLRQEYQLKLSDARLIFYTLSFIYCTFILTAGASWANYLGNQGALPWLTLGILHQDKRCGFAIISLAAIHQILSGQMAATVTDDLLLSLFALGIALHQRSWRTLFAWGLGNGLAALVVLPLLLPSIQGFLHSERSEGLSSDVISAFSVPLGLIPFSFLAGNYTGIINVLTGQLIGGSWQFPFIPTLMACAAAWCFLPALFGSARWNFLELYCLGFVAFLILLIVRPAWMIDVMMHIPILKSMRWPFREILQLQFFVHLLLVLRPQWGTPAFQRRVAIYSAVAFVVPFIFVPVPSLNPLLPDRQALFSGQADRFWAQVKTHLKPGDETATVIDSKLWHHKGRQLAYSLTGMAHFPAFFEVKCVSGYSNTVPIDALPMKTHAHFWFGAFERNQLDAMWQERPDLKIISVDDLAPLKISLLSKGQPPVDLTPYLSGSGK